MSTRVLKVLAVVLPLFFMMAVIFARVSFFSPEEQALGNIFAAVSVAIGATFFSIFIFNFIEQREEEVQKRSLQLEALHEAALALTNELDLQVVLQKVVDLSRELLNARYGALAVLDDEKLRIDQFFTSGIDGDDRKVIGKPPMGHGLLNVTGPSADPIIVNQISEDARSAGFPRNHPAMQSLLGVPIKSKGEIIGNLYLTDKLPGTKSMEEPYFGFTENDSQLLEKFATQAAIAIENAKLYRKTQELAVLQERERFSMDLHDGIMQSVYATGLSLQEVQMQLDSQLPEVHKRVDSAIADLSQVLRDIRNYILGLRPGRFQEQNIVKGISEIALELRANTLLNVRVDSLDKEEFEPWPVEVTSELLYVTQEALTNIRKHSHARNVNIHLSRDEDQLLLSIEDDGIGFESDLLDSSVGNGLRNMRERARSVGAEMEILPTEGEGTQINITVPLPVPEARRD